MRSLHTQSLRSRENILGPLRQRTRAKSSRRRLASTAATRVHLMFPARHATFAPLPLQRLPPLQRAILIPRYLVRRRIVRHDRAPSAPRPPLPQVPAAVHQGVHRRRTVLLQQRSRPVKPHVTRPASSRIAKGTASAESRAAGARADQAGILPGASCGRAAPGAHVAERWVELECGVHGRSGAGR